MSFLCIQCGDKNDDTAKFCKNCGNQIIVDSIISKPTTTDDVGSNISIDKPLQKKVLTSEEYAQERKEYGSIRGWLIFVGIGVVVSPFRIFADLVPTYKEIFLNNTLEILFQTNFSIALLVIIEMLFNIFIIFGFFYAVYTFFSKKKIFIKLYSGLLLFCLFYMIIDPIIVSFFMDISQIFDTETVKNIVKSAISVAIWVPYLFLSKRAKFTFIN